MNKGRIPALRLPEEGRLRKFLSGLLKEMIYHWPTWSWTSKRRNFGTHNLAEHLAQLKTTWATPEWAIKLMMDKPPLADYLTKGLVKLKRDGDRPEQAVREVRQVKKVGV